MVVNWSAVSQKNTHTHTHKYTHMHTHTQERERNTWEMDNRFLTTVRELTLLRAGWGARCFFGLGSVSVRGMAGLNLLLWPPQEAAGWAQLQSFLCSVKWPKVRKTFLSDEELEAGPCAEISAPLFPRFSFSALLSSSLASTPGSWFFSSFSHGFDYEGQIEMRTDMLLVFPHLFFKLMCLIKASPPVCLYQGYILYIYNLKVSLFIPPLCKSCFGKRSINMKQSSYTWLKRIQFLGEIN